MTTRLKSILPLLMATLFLGFQANALNFGQSAHHLFPVKSSRILASQNLGFSSLTISKTMGFENQLFLQTKPYQKRSNILTMSFSNSHSAYSSLSTVGFHNSLKRERFNTRKSPWLAAGMNFFLPGLGYLYTGEQPILTSLGMMGGAIGLTAVELQLQEKAPDLYPIMFGSVMAINLSIAVVTFRNTKKNNERLGL